MNTLFGVIVLLVPGALSFDYCTLSSQNTLCKYKVMLLQSKILPQSSDISFHSKPTSYGTACSQTFAVNFTAAGKAAIVSYHNTLRRQVAKGLEKRGTPGPQPAASNMRELVNAPVKIAARTS